MANEFEKNLQAFNLNARLKRYRNLVERTAGFISEALSKISKPYLACSFGKDSSVMLHLCLQHFPGMPVRFATHPETNILDSYKDIVSWWIEKYEINLQEVFCDGGLIKIRHDQRDKLNAGQWDSFFVGIRAEESFGRRVSLKKYGQFHKLKNGRVKICPLAWWREIDVASYTYENGLPLLDKYEHYGINARTTSGIARTHITENLQSLRDMNVASFNRLCELYPDVRHYV